MSTRHDANNAFIVQIKSEINSKFQTITDRQPEVIKDYTTFMTWVDKSNKLINKYNMLRKCNKWWKTIFSSDLQYAGQ